MVTKAPVFTVQVGVGLVCGTVPIVVKENVLVLEVNYLPRPH